MTDAQSEAVGARVGNTQVGARIAVGNDGSAIAVADVRIRGVQVGALGQRVGVTNRGLFGLRRTTGHLVLVHAVRSQDSARADRHGGAQHPLFLATGDAIHLQVGVQTHNLGDAEVIATEDVVHLDFRRASQRGQSGKVLAVADLRIIHTSGDRAVVVVTAQPVGAAGTASGVDGLCS